MNEKTWSLWFDLAGVTNYQFPVVSDAANQAASSRGRFASNIERHYWPIDFLLLTRKEVLLRTANDEITYFCYTSQPKLQIWIVYMMFYSRVLRKIEAIHWICMDIKSNLMRKLFQVTKNRGISRCLGSFYGICLCININVMEKPLMK